MYLFKDGIELIWRHDVFLNLNYLAHSSSLGTQSCLIVSTWGSHKDIPYTVQTPFPFFFFFLETVRASTGCRGEACECRQWNFFGGWSSPVKNASTGHQEGLQLTLLPEPSITSTIFLPLFFVWGFVFFFFQVRARKEKEDSDFLALHISRLLWFNPSR